MKAIAKYKNLDRSFWANIKTISQEVGYTKRGNKRKGLESKIKIPTITEIISAYSGLKLSYDHIYSNNSVTELGSLMIDYFTDRANILNHSVKSNLMTLTEAKQLFEEIKDSFCPKIPFPLNKQKGEKKAEAYFTCIINMLIEKYAQELNFDYDPRKLTTITKDLYPLRTLSRRVDGAFPSILNPIAIWEIKEYYYTTTFGSRAADGVYETLLDGMELEELLEHEDIKVQHYLMVDDYNTWWNSGRSYLCRMIDMLHMGYVDEVLFGKEVYERLPILVKEWINKLE